MLSRILVLIISLTLTMPILAEELIVYSARKEHLVKPLFDKYTEETGVEIKYITDKAGALLQRLKAEGKRSPADLLITVDAGNLWHAADQGLLQPITSSILNDNVPAHLRDPEGRWFGLSERARTIIYSTDRVKPSELSTYEDLADPKWKGRLCLRTSKKVYNQSLVAMLIARLGEEKTQEIVEGWVANLAVPPFSNDTKTMQAIVSGQCDVAIVNTYYFGRLEKKDPNIALKLFWPNQNTSGVHVNVSGAGVTTSSKHVAAATQFLEWLVSAEAQNLFADGNMEYPVNPKVTSVEQVNNWGDFKADSRNIMEAGKLQANAVKLMDRAGYR